MLDDPQAASEPVFVRKRSRALTTWLAVLAGVLATLWLQTRHTSGHSYNLFISGDSEAVGAQVFIDGKSVGEMKSSGGSPLGGALFYARLNNGRHLIRVIKPGFKVFEGEIDLRGEGYFSAELKPEG